MSGEAVGGTERTLTKVKKKTERRARANPT